MSTLCGVDDSGRGPVLGPMVLAGVVIDEKDLYKLKEIGVKDSKLLTPNQRENLFEQIKTIVQDYYIVIVSPKEIDDAVLSPMTNLNHLESEKFAEIINHLKADVSVIDCPSTNIPAYTKELRALLTVKTNLLCEHRADLHHIYVGAGSVLAKVTRDREIEKIQKRFKENIGSGYPADPYTKVFLKNNWNKHPEIFRHSWATYQAYSGEKKPVKTPEKNGSKKQKSIGDY